MAGLPTDEPGSLLARNRRLATAVLAALTAVFILTHFAGDAVPVRLVRAMAEAGMIGGLADWFAVEALFRHPLGLPIPHTALLPKNQARAARNIGRFFETHFLEPGQLAARLRAVEPARHLADWLAGPENARTLARHLTELLGGLLHREPSPRLLARGRAWARSQAAQAGSDAAIASGIAQLVKEGVRGVVVGEVLGLVGEALDHNRDTAVDLVQDRSRWWIASRLDRRVADLVVDGVLGVLGQLRSERSELRRGFETAFDAMVDRMEAEGALERAVMEGRRALIRTGAFDAMLGALAVELRDGLRSRLDDDPEAVARPLAEAIREVSRTALADPAARAAFDARVAELASRIIGDLRPAIAAYVADVIASWEPQELNARMEAEIGADLQFIRINGAVLGALIGGVLFGLSVLIG